MRHSGNSRSVFFFAAVIALAVAVWPTPASAIVYGFSDTAGAYPNVGAFVIKSGKSGRIYPICTGTLITPDVFVTASHCTVSFLQDYEPVGWTAWVSFDASIPSGTLTSGSTNLLPVAHVVTNPAYNQAQSDSGDIAVLILENAVSGITPATLPACGLLDQLTEKNGLKDAVFTAVGYGLQNRVVGGGVPYNENANPVPRMYAFSEFNALNPGYLRLSQNYALGNGGTCYGDSGGPNFLVVASQLVLAATTVAGDSVCRATNVDYRTDTPSAISFFTWVNETYGTSIPISTC